MSRSIKEKFIQLVWKVARLATFAEHIPFVLRFAVVTTETVGHGRSTKLRAFGMIGIVRLAVFRHMPTRNDNWVSLDRLLMHDAGMAGGAAFLLSALEKRIHVFAVTHDQPDILHRWWQITRRHFRHAEDRVMATEAHLRVHHGR